MPHPVQAFLTSNFRSGFGLFGGYKSNPSWEAVKQLKQPEKNVTLIKKQIDVLYDAVDNEIPKIWKEHKPSVSIFIFSVNSVQYVQPS